MIPDCSRCVDDTPPGMAPAPSWLDGAAARA